MACIVFLLFLLGGTFVIESYAHPAGVETAPVPVPVTAADASEDVEDSVREVRSPQYGNYDYYGSYDDYPAVDRHIKRKHKKPFALLGLLGGHGCRKIHGCGGGSYGGHGGYGGGHGGYGGGGHNQGGSFATASAGSIGSGPHGGNSHANSQSASFSIGPYTATFSTAQASSGGSQGYDY